MTICDFFTPTEVKLKTSFLRIIIQYPTFQYPCFLVIFQAVEHPLFLPRYLSHYAQSLKYITEVKLFKIIPNNCAPKDLKEFDNLPTSCVSINTIQSQFIIYSTVMLCQCWFCSFFSDGWLEKSLQIFHCGEGLVNGGVI